MVTVLADTARRALSVGVVTGVLWCAPFGAPAAAQDAASPASATARAVVRPDHALWLAAFGQRQHPRDPPHPVAVDRQELLGHPEQSGLRRHDRRHGPLRPDRPPCRSRLRVLGVDGTLPGPFQTKYQVDMQALLATVGATARVVDEPKLGVDLLVGARIVALVHRQRSQRPGSARPLAQFQQQCHDHRTASSVSAPASNSATASLIGYADIGAGNSDLTWQVLGALEYTFSNSVSAAIGYRYLGYDFGGHAPLDDLALYGPIAGVTFRF